MEIEPFQLEWEKEDHNVIQALYDLEADKPKDLRHKTYTVNGSEEWTSWTMRDHLYKKHRYPTQARGLFTMCQDGRYTVKVRGYDKFFNINETEVTQWHVLERKVQGPFEITAKENGCIIFITAPTPDTLLATSKHTIPDPIDNANSHGGMGYRWLLDHLASTMTESPASLASWVHHYRLTLVAELCDDGFEEHVVPYPTSGLYLHGINYNTTTLRTLPISVVHAVARRFGFLTVDAQSLSTLTDVRLLADRVQTDPKWNGGKESEGMVVRCRLDDKDFFFKVKNDTYLVYREYRELTKQLLKVTPEIGVVVPLKKPKVRYEKAWYYVAWLLLRVVDHPEWFAHYLENKGVVKVRLAFEQDWDAGNVALLDVDHVDRWVERDSKGW